MAGAGSAKRPEEATMTDIGTPIRKWEVIPLTEPEDDPAPREEPVTPIKEPEKEPEKVPV
jgi:hypothetical protein